MGKKTQKPKLPQALPSSKSPRVPDPKTVWKPSTMGTVDPKALVVEGMLQPEREIL
jgi:hypothetical protein